MNSPSPQELHDPLVERMKIARNSPAVLKHEFMIFRSQNSAPIAVVFEGGDDVIVYFQWIQRLAHPPLQYASYPISGKARVLLLRDSIQRDRGGLGRGVYFIVDRDFDDLRGYLPDRDIFMTDRYSVENYLVGADVLSLTLCNEFNMHAHKHEIDGIVELFEQLYDQFLDITHDVNKSLFILRQAGSEAIGCPKKLRQLVNVALESVHPPEILCAINIPCDIPAYQIDDHSNAFSSLDRRTRFRGKYALMFFCRWLDLLADDYEQTESKISWGAKNGKVRRQELTLSNFASKSMMPDGLAQFVERMRLDAAGTSS